MHPLIDDRNRGIGSKSVRQGLRPVESPYDYYVHARRTPSNYFRCEGAQLGRRRIQEPRGTAQLNTVFMGEQIEARQHDLPNYLAKQEHKEPPDHQI